MRKDVAKVLIGHCPNCKWCYVHGWPDRGRLQCLLYVERGDSALAGLGPRPRLAVYIRTEWGSNFNFYPDPAYGCVHFADRGEME